MPTRAETSATLEVELFTAANDLKNAMGAVASYTGNPNPATLAHFTTQYQNAVGEWDDSVKTIWGIAAESNPPTVDERASGDGIRRAGRAPRSSGVGRHA